MKSFDERLIGAVMAVLNFPFPGRPALNGVLFGSLYVFVLGLIGMMARSR
jgi:hypothetical protein